MHLQLSRLSETFLRFYKFTPSECPGVPQIVLLFHFESIVRREPQDRVGAFLCRVCVCVPKLRSCWAATMGDSLLHSPDCELEFCLIEGFVRGSASDVIWVLPILHLDLIWTPRTALFPCVHTAAVCPLMLLASNLLSSLSLDPPAGALWVTGSHRKNVIVFGNLPPATVRWVRNRINSRNTNRIFTSFHQWGLTGYSCTITPTGWRLYSRATWMKQLGAGNLQATVDQLFPALPRDHPCSTVPAAHWMFGKSSAYLQTTSENMHLELRECDISATV